MRSALFSLSHNSPWLARDHPDPHGEQLRQIAFVLKAFAKEARNYKGCRVGVFWDYCALPQKSRAGDKDDRTEEEKARFKRALNGINAWYGHPKTFVLLVNTPLPTGHAYTNTQPYTGRGWCVAESLMSGMVKNSRALIDASKLTGKETDISQLINNGRANRAPPMAPDAFLTMLRSGVEAGRIKFTAKGDVEVVGGIYDRSFTEEMAVATELSYGGLGWGDEQLESLAAALTFAHAKGGLRQVKVLYLFDNKEIGDDGVRALARALAGGALPSLETLTLDNNRIGDIGASALADAAAGGALSEVKVLDLGYNKIGTAGMAALAAAIGGGAMPKLEGVVLDGNPGDGAPVEEALRARTGK